MKIIQLKAENVKRLSAVTITLDGATVVVGGRNGQGKSSVLDSIMYALSGAASLPGKPIRNGSDKGQVTVDLGDMIVTRKFTTKDGVQQSSLEIKNKDGFRASSPQKILDDLCGKMAFDPLEFSRLKPKDQLDALRELVGLDFTELDRKRQQLFDRRTDINRQVKAKGAELEACPKVEDAPAEEESVANLAEELSQRERHNRENANARSTVGHTEAAWERVTAECDEIRDQIAKLQDRLSVKVTEANTLSKKLEQQKAALPLLVDQDCEEVRNKIRNADATNAKVRQNAKHEKLKRELEDLQGDAADLTDQITEIDGNKADAMASAPFPVAGLGFDAQGVTFNGLPFSQASSAEQLRVSVAMGLALNPKLRVMLIRDGSLLDTDSLALVSQMAEAADAQVWIERVSTGEEVSVVIEDGQVKAAEVYQPA